MQCIMMVSHWFIWRNCDCGCWSVRCWLWWPRYLKTTALLLLNRVDRQVSQHTAAQHTEYQLWVTISSPSVPTTFVPTVPLFYILSLFRIPSRVLCRCQIPWRIWAMSPLVGIWGEVPGASWGGTYSEGGGQGRPWPPRGHAPQSSTEWIFNGKTALLRLFSLPEVFCGPQICHKCVVGRGSAPDPAGAHDAPPDP